jgi:hypothetical protein
MGQFTKSELKYFEIVETANINIKHWRLNLKYLEKFDPHMIVTVRTPALMMYISLGILLIHVVHTAHDTASLSHNDAF